MRDQKPLTANVTITGLYGVTLLLVLVGLVMVLSSSAITSYLASEDFFYGFSRQFLWALIGVPLFFITSAIPIDLWKRYAWLLFIAAIALQMLVFVPGIGVEIAGNRNWIRLFGFSGQPSEILKLAMLVWIGTMMLRKERLSYMMKHELVPVALGIAVALGVVLLGKDLGTVMVMAFAAFGALYFGGMRWRTLGMLIFVAAAGVFASVITSENRMDRLLHFAGGDDNYTTLGWQPLHGLWALAGGGVFGVGLGGSKAKWSWLPAADNDYIFAIIGEETGMVGALFVILLYVVLAILMLRVISTARDRFGRALVGGILVWITGQAFINIAVVMGLLPVLGVPLPLISSGGTALVSCLLAMGAVIGVAKDAAKFKREQQVSKG